MMKIILFHIDYYSIWTLQVTQTHLMEPPGFFHMIISKWSRGAGEVELIEKKVCVDELLLWYNTLDDRRVRISNAIILRCHITCLARF